MKTASGATYTGPGRICIARNGRGWPKGFKMFPALAPGKWFHSVSRAEYEHLYQTEVLAHLDPQKVVDDLHALAGAAEPILLCWEDGHQVAHGTTWCHRRMASRWIMQELGIEVPELGFEAYPTVGFRDGITVESLRAATGK